MDESDPVRKKSIISVIFVTMKFYFKVCKVHSQHVNQLKFPISFGSLQHENWKNIELKIHKLINHLVLSHSLTGQLIMTRGTEGDFTMFFTGTVDSDVDEFYEKLDFDRQFLGQMVAKLAALWRMLDGWDIWEFFLNSTFL